jgi:CheY-like chemotaxis protein
MTEQTSTHVLLAEDDADDVMIFQLAIDKLPFAILLTHAENGDKLITLLEEMIPDVIFLDINMPCRSGKECIREIRSRKKFDAVPVIMYTGHKHEDYIEETFREGANFYLIKSNSVDELAEKLKNILSINWKKYMYYPTRNDYVLA